MNREAGIRVEGARELRRTLKRAGDDLGDLKRAHAEVAQIVTPAARSGAPIGSTGRLAGSGRGSGTKTQSVVRFGGASVPYANPIHWGWPRRNIEPNPFAVKAAEDTQPRWTNVFAAAIGRILDRIKGDQS